MALMTWQSIMLRPSPYQVGLRSGLNGLDCFRYHVLAPSCSLTCALLVVIIEHRSAAVI